MHAHSSPRERREGELKRAMEALRGWRSGEIVVVLPSLQKSDLLASLARIKSRFVASRFAGLKYFKPMLRRCFSCRN